MNTTKMLQYGRLEVLSAKDHCHGAEPKKPAPVKAREAFREEARTTTTKPSKMVNEMKLALPTEIGIELPSDTVLKKQAHRERKKVTNRPTEP